MDEGRFQMGGSEACFLPLGKESEVSGLSPQGRKVLVSEEAEGTEKPQSTGGDEWVAHQR